MADLKKELAKAANTKTIIPTKVDIPDINREGVVDIKFN